MVLVNITLIIIFFILCLLSTICGWKTVSDWEKRVDDWKTYPSDQEYWDSLAQGWFGLMIAVLGTLGTLAFAGLIIFILISGT